MKHLRKPLQFVLLGAVALCSCATSESIPEVRILPNDSGIEIGNFIAHQPHTFIGRHPPSYLQPDVPSGVSAQVKRIHQLRNKEPRYFTRAAGTLQIVSGGATFFL